MATLDWPSLPGFKPSGFRFGASTPKSAWGGFFTGQAQRISHLADRLRAEMTLPPCSLADAGAREAFFMQLASSGDWVRLGHFLRPHPLGDMRGTPTVYANTAAGARTIKIGKATTPTNLLTGTQAFDSAADWTLDNLTVTANTHARPSTATVSADTLTDASSSAGNIHQDLTVADDTATYTGSVYVRKTSGGTSKTFTLTMQLIGGSAAMNILRINTDSGAILGGTGAVTSSSDNVYWRISASVTNDASGNTTLRFRLDPARGEHGSATTTAATTGSAVVWGAQLEPGATMTDYEGTPALRGGDIFGVGTQLLITGYKGEVQNSSPYLDVPLALPLRQAATAGDAVTWDRPTGNFQLLGDMSQVEYLPGRYQAALNLQFVEAY